MSGSSGSNSAGGNPSARRGAGSGTRNAIWRVLRKEFLENLRDKRSLISALVVGPVLMPVLFAVLLSVGIHHGKTQSTRPIHLMVSHAARAPQLLQFLRQYGIRTTQVEVGRAQATQLVERLRRPLIYVSRGFGARLAAGRPASLRLYADESHRSEQRALRRVQRVVAAYGGAIAKLRLVARGLNPLLISPIAVHPIDLSTPQSRSALVLGGLGYVILLTMLMGGLYLAIDATAGERERGSLEPLLTLPVKREQLVYGKILAAGVMMLVSLSLTVSGFGVMLRHAGLAKLGMSVNFGPGIVIGMVLACLPLIPLGAALMTLVASFTRSYREAQTYVSLIVLIPTLPLMFASIMGLRPSLGLMAVPFLSQQFLIMALLRAQPLTSLYAGVSAAVTLISAAALIWLAGRLYRREELLG